VGNLRIRTLVSSASPDNRVSAGVKYGKANNAGVVKNEKYRKWEAIDNRAADPSSFDGKGKRSLCNFRNALVYRMDKSIAENPIYGAVPIGGIIKLNLGRLTDLKCMTHLSRECSITDFFP